MRDINVNHLSQGHTSIVQGTFIVSRKNSAPPKSKDSNFTQGNVIHVYHAISEG